MAGLLADNEHPARDAAQISGAQLIAAYLTPYGISASYSSLTTLSSFAVTMGTSAWKVIQNYCDFAGYLRPRFLANGALRFSAVRETSGQTFTEEQAVCIAVKDCREGIPSKLCRVTENGVQVFPNDVYLNDGGQCTQYENAAGKVPAARIISRSMGKRRRVELTIPGAFLAEPSQAVALKLPCVGLDGTFYVAQCTSSLASNGQLCKLTLYQYY